MPIYSENVLPTSLMDDMSLIKQVISDTYNSLDRGLVCHTLQVTWATLVQDFGNAWKDTWNLAMDHNRWGSAEWCSYSNLSILTIEVSVFPCYHYVQKTRIIDLFLWMKIHNIPSYDIDNMMLILEVIQDCQNLSLSRACHISWNDLRYNDVNKYFNLTKE